MRSLTVCILIVLFITYIWSGWLTCLSVTGLKIRVSDQSGAMLYFPLDKCTKVFSSHPRTAVTARQEGSGQTHCNNRQLTLTIMPPLLILTKAYPFSFQRERGRKRERWRWRKGEWRGWKKEDSWLASSQGKKDWYLSSRQSATAMVMLQWHPSSAL